jgi:hypothetical protein
MSRTNNATAYAETIKKRVAEVVKPQLLAFSILSMQYVLLTSIQYVYSDNNTDLFSYRYTRLLQHAVHERVGVHLLQRALHLVDD